jgi:hypothetical protein
MKTPLGRTVPDGSQVFEYRADQTGPLEVVYSQTGFGWSVQFFTRFEEYALYYRSISTEEIGVINAIFEHALIVNAFHARNLLKIACECLDTMRKSGITDTKTAVIHLMNIGVMESPYLAQGW